jgi:SulP family sulfate permease
LSAPPRARFTFRPRLWTSLAGYTRADFTADLGAGITVALVALPLAMAFAIASGVRPDQGIVTAVIGGLAVALLGGSKVQIAGPAGAFVALLYGIVDRHGVANLLVATMMAGVLLFAMGAFRLGTLIRYIPVAIVTGFTAGIAVIIALSQVRDALGLRVAKMPAEFFAQLSALGNALPTLNWVAVAVSLACVLLIVVWPVPGNARHGNWRFVTAKLPGTVAVLVLSAVAAWALHLPVETIGSRFGELERGLPMPALPALHWAAVREILGPAVAIALLGAIESLLCARVADGLITDRHDPNQELMAQGVANFAAPLFGGIAVTGTIARTMTNVKSGARTPVSGLVHSATLLLVLVALAPLASYIPLAALAAVLLWVAFNMMPWRELAELRHFSNFYRTILLATFALTVVFGLTVAVQAGLVLSSLFFIYRISSLTRVERIGLAAGQAVLPDGRRVEAWELFGSIFFGSVTKLETLIEPVDPPSDVVILEMGKAINLDTTGLDALESLRETLARRGARLIVADLNAQPRSLLERSGFIAALGAGGVCDSLEDALAESATPSARAG